MKRSSRFAAFVFVLLAIALPRSVSAQSGNAKEGEKIFKTVCSVCHTVGKGKLAGPDLAGVLNRRSSEWLHKWLSNTSEMLATDSTAMALLKENRGMKMPNVKLKDEQIENVLAYLAQAGGSGKEK
jgi:mono/diheme cytochrome c family protein